MEALVFEAHTLNNAVRVLSTQPDSMITILNIQCEPSKQILRKLLVWFFIQLFHSLVCWDWTHHASEWRKNIWKKEDDEIERGEEGGRQEQEKGQEQEQILEQDQEMAKIRSRKRRKRRTRTRTRKSGKRKRRKRRRRRKQRRIKRSTRRRRKRRRSEDCEKE